VTVKGGGFVDNLVEPLPAIEEPAEKKKISAGDTKKPAFGPGEVSVIFVLGLFTFLLSLRRVRVWEVNGGWI
jgi:hypothetical protein